MARVLGRVRLSRWTEESTSVVRQKQLITEWCKARGHEVVAWAVDENFSRSVRPFEAPEFGSWLTDPEKVDQWDITVAWRLDRFGAGHHLAHLLSWCVDHKKNLNTTTIDIDLNTTHGRLIFHVLSEMSQGEWEAVQERTLGSRQYLRSVGRWAGGKPPYWLKSTKQGTGHTLVLDPEPARVTERIIGLYLEGKPVDWIAWRLTQDEVLSPLDYYRTRAKREAQALGEEYTGAEPTGSRWYPKAIAEMMTNPALMGWSTNEGSTVRDESGGPVQAAQALITPSRWEELQSETARRETLKIPRRERGAGPLLGALVCSECEAGLHYNRQKKTKADGHVYEYVYYRSACGHNRMAPAGLVEDMVMSNLENALGPVSQVEKVFIPATDNTARLEQAERAYDEVSARLNTAPTPKVFESLTRQLDGLTAQIHDLSAETQSPARTEYRETGKTYAEALAGMTVEDVRDLMVNSGIRATLAYDWSGLGVLVEIPEDLHERLGLTDPVNEGWALYGAQASVEDVKAWRAENPGRLDD
ncbi:recombinase family protein [Amycolatopsis sp. NPDC051903]|uniref:recombinase family protein n=1 Tax=Amycolatopsis sp. NPDC051903 TaxID=3363936 RepID=UPI0037B6ACB1